MSSSDDPRKPKVEYLLPETRSYQPPSVGDDRFITRPLLRLPEEPDVPSRGWFEDARLRGKRSRVQRHQQLWQAYTGFLEVYRAYLGEEEKYLLALRRASRIREILKDDDEEFKIEMEEKERARQQKRAMWAAIDQPATATPKEEVPTEDVVMARHRRELHDIFMLPYKIREEAEKFIKEIIDNRGGEHRLTEKDRQQIADVREQTEEYIVRIQERGE